MRLALFPTLLPVLGALVQVSGSDTITFREVDFQADENFLIERSNGGSAIARINQWKRLPRVWHSSKVSYGKPSHVHLEYMTMETVSKIERGTLARATDEQVQAIGRETADKNAVQAYVAGLVAAHRQRVRWLYGGLLATVLVIGAVVAVFSGRKCRSGSGKEAMAAAPSV